MEELVAGLVPELVVDLAEVVEVQHDQAEGVARVDAPLEHVLEGPVVEQAGQVVGLGADLDRAEDLGVLQGDRDLRREQLDELELVGGERVVRAEPLDGEDADRAVATAQRHHDEAALLGVDRAELVDARVGALVRDVGRLVVLDDPGRDAGLARLPRLEVLRLPVSCWCERRIVAVSRFDVQTREDRVVWAPDVPLPAEGSDVRSALRLACATRS